MSNLGLLYFLDQDLIKIFIPFQFVLLPLGKLRCHFRDQRPETPGLYNLYIVFSLLLICTMFLYSIAVVFTYNKHFLINYILLNSAYFLIFLLTSLQILFSNKKGKIIKLMFELQELDRALGIPKGKLYYSKHETRTKVGLALVAGFHLVSLVLELLLFERFHLFSIFIIVTKLGIDVELVYLLSHLVLINSRVTFYNSILKNIKLGREQNNVRKPIDLTICFRKIICSIKLVNQIWSFQLVVLFAGEFYLISRTMALVMQHIKNLHTISIQYSLAMNCCFLVRHVLIFYLPSVRGQDLANLLRRTRVHCGDIVNACYHGRNQEECEHIVCLHDAVRPGVRMMGAEALNLDGNWPIKVFTAFAACIVVLLQLGFE